ncbi:hypothetical protein J4P02_22375 [Pseudomonas sp. NFXW11]|uniref:hypothetical protein n=1 Tax=Pseudomonas sp. NFXW11 TaxID=2819531 RepID=UPI003CF54225
MAKKARFFRVYVVDGNGRHLSFEAAFSELDLYNKITPLLSPHQRLETIEHIGYRFVESHPDEENDAVEFRVKRPSGKYWYCRVGDLSYPYLTQQFSKDVKNINDFYDERDADRCLE